MQLLRVEETIDTALQHNLSIFPLTGQKKPMCSWKVYQQKRATVREMASWIDKGAKGIALVTGRLNDIVALDIDVKNGKSGWASLKGKHIPDTVTVSTANGGTHYYFKYPTHLDIDIKCTTDTYGPNSGVDIRGEGGCVFMPFTEGYEWVRGLDDIEIAEMPQWLIDDYMNYVNKHDKRTVRATERTSKQREVVKVHKTTTTARGNDIKAYYTDKELVEDKLLPLLQLEGERVDGAGFKCVLPCSKGDTRPSASLFQMRDKQIAYRDWRADAESSDYYLLPEVYASQRYKAKKKLNAPELVTWGLRLLCDAGVLERPTIVAPKLPDVLQKKKATRLTYEGFIDLLAVKRLYNDTQNSTAFSYRFGAAWCGLSDKSVQTAMTKLQAFGFIQFVGKEGKGSRAVNVYELNMNKIDETLV